MAYPIYIKKRVFVVYLRLKTLISKIEERTASVKSLFWTLKESREDYVWTLKRAAFGLWRPRKVSFSESSFPTAVYVAIAIARELSLKFSPQILSTTKCVDCKLQKHCY